MHLKRFFIEGLAHASYLIGDDGEAAVIDPKRDVDDYIEEAKRVGLRITAILNSHPHADFASGFCELAKRTGAKIYVSHLAPAKYEHIDGKDGDRIKVGSLEVELLETPGHSPDSLSFVVYENGKPTLVFTGDLLFVNDVGRPDLRDADEDPSGLASKLYDSLFHKILALPDEVKVYPSHGAGSLCGRAISDAPFSLVGQERNLNWAMQIKDRAEFVRQMTTNLPDRPAYFSYDVDINLEGAKPLAEVPMPRAMTESELNQAKQNGATVVDTRPAEEFGAGHFPGSINIGLGSPNFSSWAGFMVSGEKPIALVVRSEKDAQKARIHLARIGFDNISGYILADRLTKKDKLQQITVAELKASLKNNGPFVLDVRTPSEWQTKHIEGAVHVPLSSFARSIPDLPKDGTIAVICGSGYRSSIATSMLQARGYDSIANVTGGMEAYDEAR
ncbi:MAG TPA: MBL fold metallo-hydrolase [Chthoniobacterales bacterium]|jgi:glyoxylase-like metal-dependent hydrolase (beta-lactamase superfamily II)